MTIFNFDVTLIVERSGEGYGESRASISLLVPENTTTSTELLDTIKESITRNIQGLIQQKMNPPKIVNKS